MKNQKLFYLVLILFTVFTLTGVLTYSAEAQVYQKIKNGKVIKIGISKHYPPLNFNKGKKGVDITIAKSLGKFLGAKVKLIPLDVQNYISSIKIKGNCPISISQEQCYATLNQGTFCHG